MASLLIYLVVSLLVLSLILNIYNNFVLRRSLKALSGQYQRCRARAHALDETITKNSVKLAKALEEKESLRNELASKNESTSRIKIVEEELNEAKKKYKALKFAYDDVELDLKQKSAELQRADYNGLVAMLSEDQSRKTRSQILDKLRECDVDILDWISKCQASDLKQEVASRNSLGLSSPAKASERKLGSYQNTNPTPGKHQRKASGMQILLNSTDISNTGKEDASQHISKIMFHV